MRRRVTTHLGGKQAVPTNKKYVIQIMKNGYLRFRQISQQSRSQALHHSTRLVLIKRHTDQGVGGARRGHTDCTSHRRWEVHARVTVAETNLSPPHSPMYRMQ